MPQIDEVAKAWQLEMAGRVGEAVKLRRKALGLTGQKLGERTRELGYPISRVTVGKIETNTRLGKLDVADLFVLAAALQIPPALLLWPSYPVGSVEALPGLPTSVTTCREWVCGDAPLPMKMDPSEDVSGVVGRPNQGVGLIGAVASLDGARHNIANFRRAAAAGDESAGRTAHELAPMLESIEKQIVAARAALWGEGDGAS
jgi:transcriptional regulator with XRE-family HTH domain